jgi:hypothetical protein
MSVVQSRETNSDGLRSLWAWIVPTTERVFQPIEQLFYALVVKQISRVLDHIDPLSQKIEGTLFKKILQVTIYPLFMAATLVIGFQLVKTGYTSQTFLASIGMYLIYGAIWMPLERLIPFSRKWLKNADGSTDVMLLLGNKLCGDWIIVPLQLATIAIVVQKISPAIGQSIWPSSLPAVAQVFLLLVINDFFRYWYHRWMHENSFMWRWHAVHHSSERLYWFNGTRSHPLERVGHILLWSIPLLREGAGRNRLRGLSDEPHHRPLPAHQYGRDPGTVRLYFLVAKEPSLSPFQEHPRRQHQLRRRYHPLGPSVRHFLFAQRQAAQRRYRHRGRGELSQVLRRPDAGAFPSPLVSGTDAGTGIGASAAASRVTNAEVTGILAFLRERGRAQARLACEYIPENVRASGSA